MSLAPDRLAPTDAANQSAQNRAVAGALVAVAAFSFMLPSLLSIAVRSTGGANLDAPMIMSFFVSVVGAFGGESFGWVLEHWIALPAAITGLFLADKRRRFAAVKVSGVVALLVALLSSWELYNWSLLKEANYRAFATLFPGSLTDNVANLHALVAQLQKTQEISVAFVAVAAGVAANKTHQQRAKG